MATTADEIRAALAGRWPDDAHLHITEAPDGPSRQGRKLDVLIVSLWKSRGYELDGVEIKVSMSDFRRELKEPAKADWWWHHVHRFWIAAPSGLATKIKAELPGSWGLLSVADSGVRVLVQPEKQKDPKPFTWPQTIGLLRATADSGFVALNRAEGRGYDRGYERGKEDASGGAVERRAQADLDQLRERVAAFEAASGIDIAKSWRCGDLGETVRLLLTHDRDPTRVAAGLDRARRQIEEAARVVGNATETLTTQLTEGEVA